mgnify:CR=1 FL=1
MRNVVSFFQQNLIPTILAIQFTVLIVLAFEIKKEIVTTNQLILLQSSTIEEIKAEIAKEKGKIVSVVNEDLLSGERFSQSQ